MGPGKPYWKTPVGSTGARAVRLRGAGPGMAAGGAVVEVWEAMEGMGAVVVGRDWFLEENKAAVTAAPEAADTPAMMARVVFDMAEDLGRKRRELEQRLQAYEVLRELVLALR